MGGSGSVMNMIVSMRQNRANKTSNKQKFRSNEGCKIRSNNHTEALHFKEIPKEELERIKNDIREKSRKERRILIIIFVITAVLVIALMIILFN
jgi:hypothetical protein